MSGLLQPSLTGYVPRDPDGARPWRLGSQIYVAIIGGPVAVTLIALVNARRLRLPRNQQLLIGAIGVATTMLAGGLMTVLPEGARLLVQLTGALAYGAFYLLQRAHDRVYFTFSPHEEEEEAYAEMWGPGIAAVVVGIVLAALMGAALGAQ